MAGGISEVAYNGHLHYSDSVAIDRRDRSGPLKSFECPENPGNALEKYSKLNLVLIRIQKKIEIFFFENFFLKN